MVVIRALPLATALWIQCFLHVKNLIRGGLLLTNKYLLPDQREGYHATPRTNKHVSHGPGRVFLEGHCKHERLLWAFPPGTVKTRVAKGGCEGTTNSFVNTSGNKTYWALPEQFS